jgi:hypothetical protein
MQTECENRRQAQARSQLFRDSANRERAAVNGEILVVNGESAVVNVLPTGVNA